MFRARSWFLLVAVLTFIIGTALIVWSGMPINSLS